MRHLDVNARGGAPTGAIATRLRMSLAWTIAAAAFIAGPSSRHGTGAQQADPLSALLDQLRAAAESGDRAQLGQLWTDVPQAESFERFAASWIRPAVTRVSLRERERRAPAGEGRMVVVDALVESGPLGRVTTWRLDLMPAADEWRITDATSLGAVDGLHRLAMAATEQFRARDLVVRGEDFALHLPDGDVFVAHAAGGVTAAVLLGRGQMEFVPSPETERAQVAIFAGSDRLQATWDAVLLRFNPEETDLHLQSSALSPVPVDAGRLARARSIFDAEAAHSYGVDLGPLTADRWSLLPPRGDLLAEVRTREYGTLTYVQSPTLAEDVSLFDRRRQTNVALYRSRERLATSGRSWDSSTRADYDVLSYSVDLEFDPSRSTFSGTTRIEIEMRRPSAGTLTVRLADSLSVGAVATDRHGQLLALRVPGQHRLIVGLPEPLARGQQLTLTVTHAGRVEPRNLTGDNLQAGQDPAPTAPSYLSPLPVGVEPLWLYSDESAWYVQGLTPDHGTARIRLTVPAAFGAVCSGTPIAGSPVAVAARDGAPARRIFVFTAPQPVPYLACAISRFRRIDMPPISLDQAETPVAGAGGAPLTLRLESSSRDPGRGRTTLARAATILSFFGSILGEVPYADLAVVTSEGVAPGGHAPAYLVTLREPAPEAPFFWAEDPVAFRAIDDFFLAHELAHQWWGQAVGWQNYHEQWLSEGLAQYFAVLHVEAHHGPETLRSVLRTLVRWTRSESDRGPIWLGYRVGHIESDSRAFRAVVYNKSAIVLHMLRLLLGDEVFFDGLRRFYDGHRFARAGTEDFRLAMERASGRSLEPFFEAWIYGQALPTAQAEWQVDGDALSLSIRQQGQVVPYPLPVTLVYGSGVTERHVVAVDRETTTLVLPLSGELRTVRFNADDTVPVDVR